MDHILEVLTYYFILFFLTENTFLNEYIIQYFEPKNSDFYIPNGFYANPKRYVSSLKINSVNFLL